MTEAYGAGETPSPGQEGYQQIGIMLGSWNIVKDGTWSKEHQRQLDDGTILQGEKLKDGRIQVRCMDQRGVIVGLEVHNRGLWGIRMESISTMLGGFTVKSEKIFAGFAHQEPITRNKEQETAFRNAAKPVAEWLNDMIKKNKFIPPTALITIVHKR